MSFNEVVIFVMAIGIILGAADKILGNKFGIGREFDEGFHALGPIGLSIVGIIVFAPLFADIVGPVVIPLYKAMGMDPSMFAIILANDLGGFVLAHKLAVNELMGLYAGTTIASMIGCTMVFSIPVGISLIKKADQEAFFKGVMLGIITMPIGSIVGGLASGIPARVILFNCIPILVLAAFMITGLVFFQRHMIKAFTVFGKLMVIISTIGLACSAFTSLTDIKIIKGLAPISDGTKVLVATGIVLLGSYPVIYIIKKILSRPFTRIGKRVDLNSDSMMGLLVALANPVPVFGMIEKMNERGKVINMAWLVCVAAALGSHLGFTAGVAPSMVGVMIIGKLVSGVLALVLAFVFTKKASTE